MADEQTTYECSDIYLAAYFIVAGARMTTRRAGKRMFFRFTGADFLALREAYYGNTGQVGARAYAEAIKACKALAAGTDE